MLTISRTNELLYNVSIAVAVWICVVNQTFS